MGAPSLALLGAATNGVALGLDLGRLTKYAGFVAAAVAIGAGLVACGATVVCIAAALSLDHSPAGGSRVPIEERRDA